MDKSFVTMEQKMCPVCGKILDTNSLLIDQRMRERFDMHTTTGYQMCDEHQALYDAGYTAMVVCDLTKSSVKNGTAKMEDVYRTGEIVHLKFKACERIFGQKDNLPMVFIEPSVAKMLRDMKNKAETKNDKELKKSITKDSHA